MKTNKYRYLFLLMLMEVSMVFARNNLVIHRGGFSMDGAFVTRSVRSGDGVHTIGGAGSLEGLYEMKASNFLLHVGLSFQYNSLSLKFPNQKIDIENIVDADKEVATRHYYLNSIKIIDRMVVPRLSLMMGGEWDRIYFLLGGNIGADLYHNSFSQLLYTATASYPFFNTELGNMPQHQLVTDEIYQCVIPKQISLCANLKGEVGVAISSQSNHRCKIRVGAFVEHEVSQWNVRSFIPIMGAGLEGDDWLLLTDHLLELVDNSLSTYLAVNQLSRRLNVGVRLTFVWESPTRYRNHRKCNCITW